MSLYKPNYYYYVFQLTVFGAVFGQALASFDSDCRKLESNKSLANALPSIVTFCKYVEVEATQLEEEEDKGGEMDNNEKNSK